LGVGYGVLTVVTVVLGHRYILLCCLVYFYESFTGRELGATAHT